MGEGREIQERLDTLKERELDAFLGENFFCSRLGNYVGILDCVNFHLQMVAYFRTVRSANCLDFISNFIFMNLAQC